MTDTPDEPLSVLREQVRQTQEAAQRIVDDARSTPRSGWASTHDAQETTSEVQALLGLLREVRDLLPEELRQQVTELVRQLLVVVRALIDFVVERLEEPPAPASTEKPVQDIPIS